MMLEYTMKLNVLTAIDRATYLVKKEIGDFLYENLEEFGDPKSQIMRCLDFSLSLFPHQGGFVVLARDRDDIVGAAVVNQTGMEGYIPANVLVYLAVHKKYRKEGVGTQLMNKVIKLTKGGIALHVEPENTAAKKLFEKFGFTHKYLEMRLQKNW